VSNTIKCIGDTKIQVAFDGNIITHKSSRNRMHQTKLKLAECKKPQYGNLLAKTWVDKGG
jgi:hypothetical protein